MTTAQGVSFLGYDKDKGQWTGKWTTLLDLVYPVGSIYLTRRVDVIDDENGDDKFSPGSYMGGDWKRYNSDACLRTTTQQYSSNSNNTLGRSTVGSDTHFHSVCGPKKYGSSINPNVGVRTSITFGGYKTTNDLGDCNILWARYNPSYCGTTANHPGFLYQGTEGFSYVTSQTNVLKFNTTNITDSNTPTGTVPGCYGWTRGNTRYSTGISWEDSWGEDSTLKGDGSVPVAYTTVNMWERIS